MRLAPVVAFPAGSLRDLTTCCATAIAILIGFALALPANAVVVFSEDFEAITLTSDPLPLATDTVDSEFAATVVTSANSLVAARSDTANNFGSGTGNKVLHFVDGSDTTAVVRGATNSAITTAFTLSFDFYDPMLTNTSVAANEPVTAATQLFLGNMNSGASPNTRAVQVSLDRGNIRGISPNGGSSVLAGTYLQDPNVRHNLVVVGNLTNDTLDYYKAGAQTLAPKTYDIYLDGLLMAGGNDIAFRNTAATEITYVTVTGTGNNSVSEGYFDNFVLENTTASPLKLSIDRLTGQAVLKNTSTDPVAFIGYEIISTIGALNPTNRKTISDNYDAGSSEEVDPNDEWFFMPDTEADFSNTLAEYQFGGVGQGNDGLTLAAGQPLDLGAAWLPTPNESELTMVFQALNGTNFPVSIEYVGNGGKPLDLGDLNHDGSVDSDDWVIFNSNDPSDTLSFTSIARAYGMGDLDGDADIDTYDYRLFQEAYDLVNGSGSFYAMLQEAPVPEPSTMLVVALGLPLALALRRRHAVFQLCLLATLGSFLSSETLQAQSVEFTFPNGSELDGEALIGATVVRSPDGGQFNRITLITTDARAPQYADAAFTWDGVTYFTTGTETHGGGGVFIDNPGEFNPSQDTTGINQHETLSFEFNRHVRVLEFNLSSIDAVDGDQGEVSVEGLVAPLLFNVTTLDVDTDLQNPFGNLVIPAGADITFTGLGSTSGGTSSWRLVGITVEELLPKMTARVNSLTGEVLLTNTGEIPLAFDSYEIRSADAALNIGGSGWNSLSDQGLNSLGMGIGQTWDEGNNVSSSVVVERFLLGSTPLQPGGFVSVGNLFDLGMGNIENLHLVFSDKQTHLLDGLVELFTPSQGLPGDFNNDGVVNLADYTVWRDNLGAADDSALNGNGDGIIGVDTADYNLWKTHFGTTLVAISPGELQQVPEPSAFVLVGVALVGLATLRRHFDSLGNSNERCNY